MDALADLSMKDSHSATPADEPSETSGQGAGGPGGHELEEKRQAPRPVGFLDLPDELLIRIYETLARPEVEPFVYDSPNHTHFTLPLDSILLNRRIYALALPIRQQALFVASYHDGHLFPEHEQAGMQQNLRFLQVEGWDMSSNLAKLIAGHIVGLKSLTTLRLAIRSHLPRVLSEQLKQCTQLKYLYLSPLEGYPFSVRGTDSDESKEDPAFSLAQHMPFLETLSVDLQNGGRELVNRGLPNLREFRLFCTYPHVVEAPWWTVPTVHFFPPKGYFRDPSWFVEKVETATRPDAGFAVEHLIIQVETVSPDKADDPDDCYYEQVIPEMLELLQRTSTLERLDFVEFCSLKNWSNSGISLPTVKTLKLFDGIDWRTRPLAVQTILSFVALFPSLTTFLLAGCNLFALDTVETIGTAAQDPVHPSLPSPASLIASEQQLRALLNELRRTPVVDFRYRVTKDLEVELRLSREKSGEEVDFEGEWWLL